ncbi:MAG: phosphoenolpyruvate carboxykinase (ATP), partial [Gammaproteobacteria bacterium]
MHTNHIKDDLARNGIHSPLEVLYNPSYEQLFAEETRQGLTGFDVGRVTNAGATAVDTGVFTGRSPRDKYWVKDQDTADTLWWSDQGK